MHPPHKGALSLIMVAAQKGHDEAAKALADGGRQQNIMPSGPVVVVLIACGAA